VQPFLLGSLFTPQARPSGLTETRKKVILKFSKVIFSAGIYAGTK
jgi:hypothetical protein